MNETEVCYKKIFKKRRKELDKVQNEQCRVQLKDNLFLWEDINTLNQMH